MPILVWMFIVLVAAESPVVFSQPDEGFGFPLSALEDLGKGDLQLWNINSMEDSLLQCYSSVVVRLKQ